MSFIEEIQITAASKAINKWVGVIATKFELEITGSTPTERMENIIEQLRNLTEFEEIIDETGNIDETKEIEDFEDIERIISAAYSSGVNAGFKRALTRVKDGTITIRKVRNEDRWSLYTGSNKFQVSTKVINIDRTLKKLTVNIDLSEHGFE